MATQQLNWKLAALCPWVESRSICCAAFQVETWAPLSLFELQERLAGLAKWRIGTAQRKDVDSYGLCQLLCAPLKSAYFVLWKIKKY